MTQNEVLDIFKEAGAFLEGHFVLTSGLHSPHYIEKFRVLERPQLTARLCAEFADHYRDAGITVVVGPVTGGVILAHETAKQLGVLAMFTERVDGKMTFRRGFKLTERDVVLVVEDIVTTGGSVFEVIDVVRGTGARLAGVGLLADRSGGKVAFDVPVHALMTLDVVAWQPDQCPLCAGNVPVTKPGSTGK
jgi:orotate phosphoribosyltransferase